MHYFLHYLVPGDAVAPSSVRWRTESGLFVTYLSGRSTRTLRQNSLRRNTVMTAPVPGPPPTGARTGALGVYKPRRPQAFFACFWLVSDRVQRLQTVG